MKSRARINPLILRWAREERGLSIEEASKKIGVSETKLKACESGDDTLTLRQFRQAAQVYRRPTAIFYLRTTPSSLKIPEFRRIASQRERPLSPELRLEIRRLYLRKKTAENLVRYGPEYDWSFVGSVQTDEDPEEVALKVRKLLKITDSFPKGLDAYHALKFIRNAVESVGILVFIIPNIQVDEMRGISLSQTPYPVIAVNRGDSPRARIFSIIHELVHILLGESTVCDISNPQSNEESSQNVETFCNYVAGATLVPKDILLDLPIVKNHDTRPEWTDNEIDIICKRFRVSRYVVLRRLLTLHRTTYGYYQSKAIEWSSKVKTTREGGWGEKIPDKVIRIMGASYVNLIMNALNDDAISLGDVAEVLDMKLKHLSNLEETLYSQAVALR
ncbi:MAG: ImmA/IrrE family metallo-endopeptidase [Candidatus Thorarchaeota archaeon]